MPALPPVNKALRVDLLINNQSNSRIRDRIFLAFTGAGPSVVDLTTLANTIATAWANNIAGLQSNLSSLLGVTVTDLTSATGAQAVTAQNKPGTVAGAFSGAAVAAVVKFKIARRYRGGHPRFYLVNSPWRTCKLQRRSLSRLQPLSRQVFRTSSQHWKQPHPPVLACLPISTFRTSAGFLWWPLQARGHATFLLFGQPRCRTSLLGTRLTRRLAANDVVTSRARSVLDAAVPE
jgi:hypothetical protein